MQSPSPKWETSTSSLLIEKSSHYDSRNDVKTFYSRDAAVVVCDVLQFPAVLMAFLRMSFSGCRGVAADHNEEVSGNFNCSTCAEMSATINLIALRLHRQRRSTSPRSAATPSWARSSTRRSSTTGTSGSTAPSRAPPRRLSCGNCCSINSSWRRRCSSSSTPACRWWRCSSIRSTSARRSSCRPSPAHVCSGFPRRQSTSCWFHRNSASSTWASPPSCGSTFCATWKDKS